MSVDIKALHKRLDGASNSISARQAVVAIFHAVSSRPGSALSEDHSRAIHACLTSPLQAVQHEAIEQLASLVTQGLFSYQNAQELIFSVLPSVDPCCASSFSSCLVSLLLQQQSDSSAASAAPSRDARGSKWSNHPLSVALLLQPACGASLVSSAVSSLKSLASAKPATAPGKRQGGKTLSATQAWSLLQPFFSYLLLNQATDGSGQQQPQSQAVSWSSLRGCVTSQLLRLTCNLPQAYGMPVLHLLTQYLSHVPLSSQEARSVAAQSVADTLDVVETLDTDIGPEQSHTAQQLAQLTTSLFDVLLNLAWEVAHVPGGQVVGSSTLCDVACLQQILAGLRRLQHLRHVGSTHCLPQLAALAASTQGQVQDMCMALMYEESSRAADASLSAGSRADHQLTVYPLSRGLAYASSATTKAWASILLGRLTQHLTPDATHVISPDAATTQLAAAEARHTVKPGEVGLMQLVKQLLVSMDRGASDSQWLHWLGALEQALQAQLASMKAAQLAARGSGQAQAAQAVQDLSPVLGMLLAALLVHTSAAVSGAAVSATRALLAVQPQAGVPLMPVVLYCIQRLSKAAVSDGVADTARVQAGLLGLLAPMLAHPSAAPFALRVLQPMQADSAPLLLRCLAVRLVVEAWLTTGQGWAMAEAALLGYVKPGSPDAPLPLRITRAGLLVAVAQKDPQRAVDLVAACQECIQDPSPEVVSLGLSVLTRLCDTDLLDFYKAWKVIHRVLPKLPTHPMSAAAWVAFLGTGYLDARGYPSEAAALLAGLWAATKHASQQVRAAAYTSLLPYSLEVVEQLEVLAPLAYLTQPLLSTAAASASAPPLPLSSKTSSANPQTASATASAEQDSSWQDAGYETDSAVRQAMERLAVNALRFEHENRRRFFAMLTTEAGTADGPAKTGQAGVGAGDAASRQGGAAAVREAASIRHRLLRVLPALLAARSTTGVGPGNSRVVTTIKQSSALGSPCSAAALLLMYKSPGSTALQGAGGLDVLKAVLQDALRTLGVGTFLLEHLMPPGWEQGCWSHFFSQHQGARQAPTGSQDTFTQLQSLLQETMVSGDVSVRAAAPLALSGLCTAEPLRDHTDAVKLLIYQTEQARSPAEISAALVALASTATRLHDTDEANRARALVTLARALRSHTSHQELGGEAAASSSVPPVEVIKAAVHGITSLACAALPHVDHDSLGSPQDIHTLSQLSDAVQAWPADVPSQVGSPNAIVCAALTLLLSQLIQASPAFERRFQSQTFPGLVGSAVTAAVDGVLQTQAEAYRQRGRVLHLGPKRGGLSAEPQAHDSNLEALPCLAGLLLTIINTSPRDAPTQPGAVQLAAALAGHVMSVIGREITRVQDPSADPVQPSDSAQMSTVSSRLLLQHAITTMSIITTAAEALPEVQHVVQGSTESLSGQPLWQVAAHSFLTVAGSDKCDGDTRGRAAVALGYVSSQQHALQPMLAAQPGGDTPALTQVVDVLCDVAAGARGVGKGSFCAAARQGAAFGLAALLAGPALTSRLLAFPTAFLSSQSDQAGLSSAGGLLAQLDDHPKIVRTCLKTLDQLYRTAATSSGPTGKEATPGAQEASAAAGFALAVSSLALCRIEDQLSGAGLEGLEGDEGAAGAQAPTVESRGQPSAGASSTQPLSRYPPDGPLRKLTAAVSAAVLQLQPLVTQGSGSDQGQRDQERVKALTITCSALSCLAAAPRLAAHDYATPVNQVIMHSLSLLSSHPAANPQVQHLCALVHVSALDLALAHGREPATGLASLLNTWTAPVKLFSLQHPAACLVLSRLVDLAGVLARSRTARLLPELATAVADAVRGDQPQSCQLAGSMWVGLGLMFRSSSLGATATPLHADVLNAAVQAACTLFSVLAPVPGLLPGELSTLREAARTLDPSTSPVVTFTRATPLTAPNLLAETQKQLITDRLQSSTGTQGKLNSLESTGALVQAGHGWPAHVGRSDAATGRTQLLGLWCRAGFALWHCNSSQLPPELLLDAAFHQANQQLQQHSGGSGTPAAHISASQATAALMRSLLVCCGGGQARLGSAQLVAVRVWAAQLPGFASPAQSTHTSSTDSSLAQSILVTLGAALVASCTSAQLVPFIISGITSSPSTRGVQLAVSVTSAALRAVSLQPAPAAESVLAASVCCVTELDKACGASVVAARQVDCLTYLLPRLMRSSLAWFNELEGLVELLVQHCEGGVRQAGDAAVACLAALRHVIVRAAGKQLTGSNSGIGHDLAGRVLACIESVA